MIPDGPREDRGAPARIAPGRQHPVDAIEPLGERASAGRRLGQPSSREVDRASRLGAPEAHPEVGRLPHRPEPFVEVLRERAPHLEHPEERVGRPFAAVDGLEHADGVEAMISGARELLEGRSSRGLGGIEGEGFVERGDRGAHVVQPLELHPPHLREQLRAHRSRRRQLGILLEGRGELGPALLLPEHRHEDLEDVARRPEAGDDACARLDGPRHVVGLARAHLNGAHHQSARGGGILRVLRALFEQPRELVRRAAGLVEGRQGGEGVRARARRQEPLVGGDGARLVLDLHRQLAQSLVGFAAAIRVGLQRGDALEYVAEGARILLLLEDLPERAGRDEHCVRGSVGDDEHRGQRRLGALRVAGIEQHLSELGAGPRLDRGLLGHGKHPTERLGRVRVSLQPARQLDVLTAQPVVGRVDRQRLLERIERALVVAHPLVFQPAQASEELGPLRTAGVLELDRQIARDLLRRSERLARGRERCGRPAREPLDDDELLRCAPRCLVRRLGREELFDVRHRALGLVQLVGVELDDAGEEPSLRRVGGRRVGRERLFVEA